MALGFNQQKGGAQKSSIESVPFVNNENRIRLVGDILARYVYWIKGENDKNIPFECLAFDRNVEAFNNKEKDWVKTFYPDLKCSWAYSMQGIDLSQAVPVVKVVNMKKKLWEQILLASETLGDPTDPDNGWDLIFTKKKTGPHVFNVEYTLNQLKLKKRPLNEAERAAIVGIKSMDEIMVRPTPDAQKALLEKIQAGAPVAAVDDSVESEFDVA